MKKKTLAFAVLATMLASCANNDEPAVVTEDNAPITVTAGVNELEARAGHDSSNLPAKFYLTIDQDETAYDYTNVVMTKAESGNTYTAAETLLWADNGDHSSATIYAYTTNAETFTVQTDQTKTTDGLINSDLLGATSSNTGDVTVTNDNIAIAFRHLLCKLDVTFEWGDEYASVSKSITSVTYSGFGTNCELNRTIGTITPGNTTDKITAYLTTTETGYLSEAIFAPQTLAPEITIVTQIDGAEKRFKVTVPSDTDFASGNRYTMSVKIGGTVAEVTQVTANGWGDSVTGNGIATE